MAESKTILDYQRRRDHTPHRRISIPAVIAYSAMLTGVLYLLLFQTSKDGPMMAGGNMPPALKANIDSLAITDAAIATAANGQNVQLHVSLPDNHSAGNLNWFVVRYFSSAYRLYPHRVYVGSDDQIINGPEGFFAADHLPPIAWMRAHHVTGVFTLSPPQE